MANHFYLKYLIPSFLINNLRYHLGVPSQKRSFNNLKRLGFIPATALDIGAYNGEWSTGLNDIFPNCKILMFEGQTSKETILKQVCRNRPGFGYRIALLGASESRVNFNIYDSASSVLEEYNETGAVIEQRKLDCLDDLVKGTIYNQPDFIKVDTQGYELEILRGGEETLQRTQAVLLEVSLLNIYKDCPLVADVMTFMTARDFVLYDICSLMRRPLDKALFQSDFLFVKKSSSLLSKTQWI
jgi:FkbM family methyltransferase